MELPRGEDEPQIEHRRYTEALASQEELDELMMLADQLLAHSETIYGSESIRRCERGTMTLQASVMEDEGVNVLNSSVYLTGPSYPEDQADIIASFDFSEAFELPCVTFKSAPFEDEDVQLNSPQSDELVVSNQERGRDILIDLIMSGKLSSEETELAKYCLVQLSGIIDGYVTTPNTGITAEDGTFTPFVKVISEQIEKRTKDFTAVRHRTYNDDIEDYELTVTAISPSNTRRPTNLPRLQIVMDEYNLKYKTSILLKPDDTFVAIETDHYGSGEPTEILPELYHVQKLREAVITALAQTEDEAREYEQEEETVQFLSDPPYKLLLDTASRAWKIHDSLAVDSEHRDETGSAYSRAMELLRQDYEARYHLIPAAETNDFGAHINLDNIPDFNPGGYHRLRNVLMVLTSVFFIETDDGFQQINLEEDSGLYIEYNTLEAGTLLEDDSVELSDVFLVGRPNRESQGRRCLVPLSRSAVVNFVSHNN